MTHFLLLLRTLSSIKHSIQCVTKCVVPGCALYSVCSHGELMDDELGIFDAQHSTLMVTWPPQHLLLMSTKALCQPEEGLPCCVGAPMPPRLTHHLADSTKPPGCR